MSAISSPSFTVVVPLYDKARYIGATLASIASQTYDAYDVLVVDDGSNDDGPAQVEAVGGRVRLVRQINAGPGAARNRGIAEATGNWIAFLDADDLWRPNHLATLARAVAACPTADIVATGFDRATLRGAAAAFNAPAASGGPRFIDFFTDYALVWTSAVAVRTTILRAERFGNGWPGEDVELWTRLAFRHRIAVDPMPTAIYLQETQGVMDSRQDAEPIPIADQPVFATIAAALADPALTARHDAIAAYRNALLLDYIRPALFNGHLMLARDYLRQFHAGGGRAPWLYRLLTLLPARVTRVGSRAFGTLKRFTIRQS